MEGHPNFHDDDHFSDCNQHQIGSVYDGLYSGGGAEGWSLEGFRYEGDLDVSHFQPVSVFEPENSSAQASFIAGFTSSQSSSHTAFGCARNNHSNSTWVLHEATEAQNWLPTSDAIAVDANFRQESNNVVGIANSPGATVFVPPYKEPVKPPVHALQQNFEPMPDGEKGESLLYINSLYVPPTPFLTALPALLTDTGNSSEMPLQTAPTGFRSLTKQNLRASKSYCNIHPCNHQKAFSRKADLERHLSTQHLQLHSSKKKLSQCPWPDCERKGASGFPRRDKMLLHQDRVHGRRL
jgi:hypothetical protein